MENGGNAKISPEAEQTEETRPQQRVFRPKGEGPSQSLVLLEKWTDERHKPVSKVEATDPVRDDDVDKERKAVDGKLREVSDDLKDRGPPTETCEVEIKDGLKHTVLDTKCVVLDSQKRTALRQTLGHSTPVLNVGKTANSWEHPGGRRELENELLDRHVFGM